MAWKEGDRALKSLFSQKCSFEAEKCPWALDYSHALAGHTACRFAAKSLPYVVSTSLKAYRTVASSRGSPLSSLSLSQAWPCTRGWAGRTLRCRWSPSRTNVCPSSTGP